MRATVGSSGVAIATGVSDFGTGAGSPAFSSPRVACVPSQNGAFAVDLH